MGLLVSRPSCWVSPGPTYDSIHTLGLSYSVRQLHESKLRIKGSLGGVSQPNSIVPIILLAYDPLMTVFTPMTGFPSFRQLPERNWASRDPRWDRSASLTAFCILIAE